MLDPRRLFVLREFAAQGTIAGAAEALAFTPSAVSQQLAQLQREAGVELLRKVGRRLELTDAGRTLVARADELLAHVELVEGEAEESLPMVLRGELDVAIAEEYEHAPRPRLPQLHREYLKPDQLVLALPRGHPAAERGGPVALAALRDARWAAPRAPSAFADMVARLCRSVGGFEPDVRHRAYDLYLLIELVAVRGAVALLPALGRPERDPRIAVRPIADGEYTRALFVATRESDRARPSTAAIVRALREARPDA